MLKSILNFTMIGFHHISLSTFIRNFALYYNVKKFEKFPKLFKVKLSKTVGLLLAT